MRLSKTAMMELSQQYRSILKKCFLLNAAALIAFGATGAVAASVEGDITSITEPVTVENGKTATFSVNVKDSNLGDKALIYVAEGGTATIQNSTFENIESSMRKGSVFGVVDKKTASLTIVDSTFKNNVNTNNRGGGSGTSDDKSILNIYGNTTFEGNTANTNGGAVYTSAKTTIDGREGLVKFIGNMVKDIGASGNEGGGALFVGMAADVSINKTRFENNDSQTNGGAIATRHAGLLSDPGEINLVITNSEFENNTAALGGGAIYNTFYKNLTGSTPGGVTGIDKNSYGGPIAISGTSFKANSAKEGGAVYNYGLGNYQGAYLGVNPAAIRLTDTTFTGNTATETGGAIFNNHIDAHSETVSMVDATGRPLGDGIILAGTNVFSGNKAAGKANDIHNLGNLTIESGVTTMDGGVTGDTGWTTVKSGATLDLQGDATVTQENILIESGANLKANLNGSTILSAKDITIGENVNVTFTTAKAGEHTLVKADNTLTVGGNKLNQIDDTNSLYNYTIADIAEGDKTVTVNATVKDAGKVAETLGVSQENATVISGITELANPTEEGAPVNKTATSIVENMQALANAAATSPEAKQALQEAADALAPTETATVQSVSSSVSGQVFTAVGDRMSPAPIGQSSGEAKISKTGPWVKGLYNKAEQEGRALGFNGYTKGVAMGLDGAVREDLTIGFGYAYTNTNVKSLNRKTDVDGNSYFVYGKYQPNAWWMSAALSYGMSSYEENANVAGVNVESKYDVDTIGVQLMTGYDTKSGFTPQIGGKYLYVKPEEYTSSAGVKTSGEGSDLFTAVIGGRYGKAFIKDDIVFIPQVRFAATYDVVSEGAEATVTVGSSSYTNKGKRLPRFGVEAGVGITMTVADKVDLSLDYDASIRRDYTSHTGTVSLKYNF